jgi:hypothetical protein
MPLLARSLLLAACYLTGCSSKTTLPRAAAAASDEAMGARASRPAAPANRRRGGGPYPLAVSPDKRYLVGQNGAPFLIAGDAPQCLTVKLSVDDMEAYFATRAGQGFNAAWVNALCNNYTGGTAEATTADGIAPFLAKLGDGHYDLSAPNPDFFARVDAALTAAARHGVVLFLDPIETGGFLETLRANGPGAARRYGNFMGKRYAAADNVVWLSGNDFRSWTSSSDDALVSAVALGIRDTDTRHLQTVELDYPTYMSSLDDPVWARIVDFNTTYTYHPTYAQLYTDYDRLHHLPNVMIEANYEGENISEGPHLTNAHDCRTQYYWTNLSGAAGSFYGNHEVWPLTASWKAHMSDPGAAQMRHVQALFGPRAWYELVPDQDGSVIVSGAGDFSARGNAQDNTYATTARTDNGTLVMTYMPTARPVTTDMRRLSAPATARWYDPTTGAYAGISGSPFANTGQHTFTPPTAPHADGFTDWVLVLETRPPP